MPFNSQIPIIYIIYSYFHDETVRWYYYFPHFTVECELQRNKTTFSRCQTSTPNSVFTTNLCCFSNESPSSQPPLPPIHTELRASSVIQGALAILGWGADGSRREKKEGIQKGARLGDSKK